MINILGALGLVGPSEREVFLRRGIPLPDDLKTPQELMIDWHRANYRQLAEQAIKQGIPFHGYSGDASGGGLLLNKQKAHL